MTIDREGFEYVSALVRTDAGLLLEAGKEYLAKHVCVRWPRRRGLPRYRLSFINCACQARARCAGASLKR